ncbi:MAG: DNA-methyltransferase [Acidimicrobiales bacterium]
MKSLSMPECVPALLNEPPPRLFPVQSLVASNDGAKSLARSYRQRRSNGSAATSVFTTSETELAPVVDLATDESFAPLSDGFQLQVSSAFGKLYQGDTIDWLRKLPSESVDLAFADPPYNIKKASWDSFESQEAYIEWSMKWIEEVARILSPSGTLYVCGFSEVLADLRRPSSHYFPECRWLVWHYKNKANLGSDWGRSHESIMHLRKSNTTRLKNIDLVRIPYGAHTLKYPSHPQSETSNFGKSPSEPRANWEPHPMGAKAKDVIDIPTTCNGMNEKTPHPTQKPEELLRKFVLASSVAGETVLDPFSGSGTTAVVCEQLRRNWLACDLDSQYNSWAAQRLATVRRMTETEWFEYDRAVAERRESIR